MQENKFDQRLGICQRLFNFIMNTFIGRGMKRVTLGQPLPQGSTNGAQEPLISHANLKDDSDSLIQIHFKKTEEEEELQYWTPIDKLGSSVHVAEKDESQGRTQLRIDGESSRAPKIVIPITNSVNEEEKKKKAGNKFPSPTAIQPDASKPILTGLGLNINEISETFIQNTKERLSRNVSLMEPEES
ncbi:hypothetical protein CCACVL1_14819 [Corchorus capsularis]|uniref:Uncharacterized protein n=1 Tax=Corchorus capsularis TaxID=210143 RepID=A0A1R3I5J2_COCAP|nr:hypothetical protein CCACVL1_14819 [Corchorus capsularis]